MELVYLWVEEYKNIKRQGFNFSPKFECKFHDKYDENGKLLDNCELEIKPKEHIENFFGDNINITAIVGKNGSGKSSLLEIIKSHHSHSSFIVVFFINFKFYILSTIQLNQPQGEKVYLLNDKIQPSENFEDLNWLDNNFSIDLISTNNQDNELKDFISYIRDDYHQKYFGDYFVPTNITIKIDDGHALQFDEKKKKVEDKFENLKELREDLENDKSFDIFLYYLYIEISFYELDSIGLNKVSTIENYRKVLIDTLPNLYQKEERIGWNNDPRRFLARPSISIEEMQTKMEYAERIFKKRNHLLKITEVINWRLNSLEYNIDVHQIDTESDLFVFKELPEVFKYTYIDEKNGLHFYNLSDGEQKLIKTKIQLENAINANKKKNYIFLLDEPNTYLHPEWERKFLSYFIDIFKVRDENFHFILTSHSPFFISDIPKQNIIFLDKDENGNCKVVDGLKKETFGANIHTLLSDSFFMEKGLMGEFAKSKINKIVRFLNGKNKFIDFPIEQIKQVIDIIGEPFLKEKLLRMYDEKYPKTNKEKIAELEAEIERLKNGQN